jgi:hypothetical protein
LLLTLKELFDVVAFQFAHPMTQKSLNLVKEGMSRILEILFDDRYVFGDGWLRTCS